MSQYATLPLPETWDDHWAEAYSFGHNFLRLQGQRLAHFAHAFADICEEFDVALPLGEFFQSWNHGVYHGTPDGNWHLAAPLYRVAA